MRPKQIPVVVAGLDVNGLGVVRALHGAGVEATAIDTDLHKPTMRTRFGRKFPIASLSGPEFIASLRELRGRFDVNPVLLLTQEASVATVSAAREAIAPLYRMVMPGHDLVTALQNKIRFQELAERHGFAIPHAVRAGRASGLEAVSRLRFPCVVKPASKDSRYGKRFAKAYRVESTAEVERLWRDIGETVDDIIVQEWIDGGDDAIYFCLQYRPLPPAPPVSFVGRKLRQWPPLVGGTALCVPAPGVAAELTSLTNRFFAAVGFAGLCSMEFKRDSRDGTFYMVEPTAGRTDYQEEIAVLNGVNIPFAAYCDACGIPMPAFHQAPSSTAWRDPLGYANAVRAAFASGSDAAPGTRIYDAYFRVGDPMPYIALKFRALAGRLGW